MNDTDPGLQGIGWSLRRKVRPIQRSSFAHRLANALRENTISTEINLAAEDAAIDPKGS